MVHEAVDALLEKFEDFFKKGEMPTVTEISERFNETKRGFFGQCLESMLQTLATDFLRQEYAEPVQNK